MAEGSLGRVLGAAGLKGAALGLVSRLDYSGRLAQKPGE